VQQASLGCTVVRWHAASNVARGSNLSPHSALTAPLVLHNTRIYKCAMKKIIFNGQRRNKHFLIVIYCELRNGVKKTPQFLPFSMEKGEPSAQ
jgi:hypothetical protein